MPPVNQVAAVLTQTGANALAQITAGQITTTGMLRFRVGEGGFIESGGVKFPDPPVNTQTMLDADNPALIPALTVTLGHVPFVFQKNFVATDFANPPESGVIFVANSLLDFADANNNGVGGAPRFFEIGLFFSNTITSRQIGTGDGIATSFLFTAPSLPVTAASFVLSFTNPGPVVKTVTDNGVGVLIGNVGAGVNTINYTTGAINVTFDVAPGVGIPITVSYGSRPLVVYGTFPEEIKTVLVQLLKIVRISY